MCAAGRLPLNTELPQMSKGLGEFVIVDELVHLPIPNHGKVFNSFTRAYLPDWEERHERLRAAGRPDSVSQRAAAIESEKAPRGCGASQQRASIASHHQSLLTAP